MMRSLRLLPTRRPVSNTCRSAGALMAIHPETLPPCGLVIGTTSDAVAPGSISTSSLKLPESFSSTTRWVPAVKSSPSGTKIGRDAQMAPARRFK